MRFSTKARTSGLNERTLNPIVACAGSTLAAWPACSALTVTTASSMGSILRETSVCSAMTRLLAVTSGSIDSCGGGARLPLPMMSILTVAQHEGAGGNAGVVVHAENRIAGEALEQAILQHLHGAAVETGFFGGLEEIGRAHV